MPIASEAFLAGRLTPDHVRVLAEAQQVAPQSFRDHETDLVALADDLSFRSFVIAIRYWRDLRAHDGGEAAAARRDASRGVHCSETLDGMGIVDGLLDPIGMAIFSRELHRLERELFDVEWAETKASMGVLATVSAMPRTAAQRRHDALIEMARRSAAKPSSAKEPRALITVLMGEDSFRRTCELWNRAVVTPGEVFRILVDADIERVLFDGPSRVLDVGVRQRLFTGATRRAVEVTQRTCAHASCEVPSDDCDIDHVEPYERGGLTVQENGRPFCDAHHRWHHGQMGPP